MTKQFHELSLISVPSLCRIDPSRKADIMLLAEAAAECLTEFSLCNNDLAERFHADPVRFEILLGDLTDDGLAFARVGFQRWLANTDRWKPGATLDKFKNALIKQLENTRGNAH